MADPTIFEQLAEAGRQVLELSEAAACIANCGAHSPSAELRQLAKNNEARIAKLTQVLKTKNPADLPAGFTVRPATRNVPPPLVPNWK